MAKRILPYEPRYKLHQEDVEKPTHGALQLYEREIMSPSIVPEQSAEKFEVAGAPRGQSAVNKR